MPEIILTLMSNSFKNCEANSFIMAEVGELMSLASSNSSIQKR